MEPVTVALTFAAIFVVELPDKTFIASLILATRYRGLYVWAGVSAAFAVQTLVAVTAGGLVALLPPVITHTVAAAVFLIGAIVLVRTAPSSEADAQEEREKILARGNGRSAWSAVGAAFLVIFAAEWGDLSQLLTASLAAHYHDPVSVLVGAWTALAAVSAIAVVGGRAVQRHLPLAVLHYIGAAVCAVLAVVTMVQLLG